MTATQERAHGERATRLRAIDVDLHNAITD